MKKIIATTLISCLLTSASAQTEKGDWMVGGGLRLNTSNNRTEIAFSPNAGIFVINNFAIGGNISLDYTKSGDTKITSFGIGPFVRYYFTTANVRPLLQANINYLSTKVKIPSNSSTNNEFKFFLFIDHAFYQAHYRSRSQGQHLKRRQEHRLQDDCVY